MKTLLIRIAASALVLVAHGLSAATITNPGFEADTFTIFPGYVSGNGPIAGWTGNADHRVGLNPAAGSPFANNGTIPEGSQAAFIQNDPAVVGGVTLSTVISGLNFGESYKVNFRVNARQGNTPNLQVEIDGTPIINTAVTAVGGSSPYKFFAFDFTAFDESQTLTLRNAAISGDHTVLIDDFSIAPLSSGWSYTAWTDDSNSGVDSANTYSHAYSFGSATPTAINGVNFTGVAGGNPGVPGSFSTAGLPNVFNNDPNNVSGGSRQLANDFLYGGSIQSITINGLIPSGEYVATIFSVGWEDGTRAATFSVGNDRLTVNQDQFGNNNGIRVSYRYVATSSSITLSYVPLQGNTFHTYGFANFALSLPSAPAIGSHPRSQCVGAGETVTFSVTAAGSEPLTYYWSKNGVDLGAPSSSSLTLPNVTTADDGVYSVIVSNNFGAAASSNATLKVGLAMVNRSFEADTFSVFPGYVSANAPITGWSSLGNHGINPGTTFSPFADNGAIPDGRQVAFMQGDGALSQVISGFTVGDDYYVVYFENARSGGVPAVEVKIGGATIVPAHSRAPVGGANPYVEVTSDAFTATATDLQLSIIKSNPNGGDTTALIDNICVLRIPAGTAPFFSRQPAGQTVETGNPVTFTAGAVGSLPFSHQWRRNGVDIPGATSPSFSIPTVAKSDEGDYTVVVSNDSGSATSLVARLDVFEPITTLFNTGVDNNRAPLPDNADDPHYVLTVNPDGDAPINAIVEDSTAFPIVTGPWLANSSSSKWVGPRLNTSQSAVGLYTYRTTFDLTNRDPDTVVIIGGWASDNSGRDILVNGASTRNPQSPGFGSYTSFMISTSNASFLPGVNSLDFVVENEGAIGYTGLRVEFTASNARIVPNIPPEITSHPVGQTVVEGDDVVLSVTATGSDPLTYRWTRNGGVLDGKTNRILTLPQIAECDSGDYQVIVQNNSGSATSQVATVSVAFRRVAGIFGTGLTDTGALAPNGAVDLHYTLVSSSDPAFPGPEAYVMNDGGFPIPPWIASGPRSKWIAPQADQSVGNVAGDYIYQAVFDIPALDMSRFRIAGQWAVDNAGTEILVNGFPSGITSAGFSGFTPFIITENLFEGLNTLDFVVNNLAGPDSPTGLRVDLAGLIDIRPTLSITRVDGSHVSVGWTPTASCHRLQAAPDLLGPWTTVPITANPQTFDTTQSSLRFFRIAP